MSPYQTTFETKHLQHRGAEHVVPDLIRFVCFNFHPDNQVSSLQGSHATAIRHISAVLVLAVELGLCLCELQLSLCFH